MTPSEQLAQAQLEYHNLMTGMKVRVFVDQNGERVEYTNANAVRLKQYIQELERTLNPALSVTGPLRVFF
jgi:hypothetical protein